VRALRRLRDEEASRFACGRLLHQRYLLQRLLGKGGFSEVFQARAARAAGAAAALPPAAVPAAPAARRRARARPERPSAWPALFELGRRAARDEIGACAALLQRMSAQR
jgi:serine/threonine protein kinase